MVWRIEWGALSARIVALIEANSLLVRAPQGDYYGHSNTLILPHSEDLWRLLTVFVQRYSTQLPLEVKRALDRHLELKKKLDGSSGTVGAAAMMAILGSLRAEMAYLLNDVEQITIASIERAFSHLQRGIVADPQIAEKWQAGYRENETRCEQLGALHLLSHQIWAFKVNGEGERTDLVQNTTIDETLLSEVGRTAAPLALTEWKLVRREADAAVAIEQAARQARLYANGVLASAELRSVRYLVIVSEERVRLPPDTQDAGILYRHVNIAVRPNKPSAARG